MLAPENEIKDLFVMLFPLFNFQAFFYYWLHILKIFHLKDDHKSILNYSDDKLFVNCFFLGATTNLMYVTLEGTQKSLKTETKVYIFTILQCLEKII